MQNLVVDLSDKSEDFLAGMEVGKVWAMMKDANDFSMSVHSANMGVIERMANAYGYTVEVASSDEVWSDVTLTKGRKPEPKFRVVN